MESATRFERDSRCKALGAISANVLKLASHVYIRLEKWIIDSAFRILQNAEKVMQAFFAVKRFLQLGLRGNARAFCIPRKAMARGRSSRGRCRCWEPVLFAVWQLAAFFGRCWLCASLLALDSGMLGLGNGFPSSGRSKLRRWGMTTVQSGSKLPPHSPCNQRRLAGLRTSLTLRVSCVQWHAQCTSTM
jgi:hypothetical protein